MNGSSAAAAAVNIKTTNFFDKGVTVGEYVFSYGEWPYQTVNAWNESMNDAVSYFVNFGAFFDSDIIGENRSTHPSWAVHADFTADPYVIKQATQTNDLASLTNALANSLTGSWYFGGHSSATAIIRGSESPPYLSIYLAAWQLAELLGNYAALSFTNLAYNRRYFSTMITGCGALNGSWPLAVGTPPGVNQWDNPLIRKSAYVAFGSLLL